MRRVLLKILSPLNKLSIKVYRLLTAGMDLTPVEEAPLIRGVEYAFVTQTILKKTGFYGGQGNVLDVGCTSAKNLLSPILASLGYQVYGIDSRRFKFEHPNFHFTKHDARDMPFADNFFDYVYAVSTIEHVGLTAYHSADSDPEGDIKVMKEIARVIRPGGTLLVTLPYGQAAVLLSERVYDDMRIQRLFSGWQVTAESYYHTDREGILKPVEKSEAAQAAPENAAIAMFSLELLAEDQRQQYKKP